MKDDVFAPPFITLAHLFVAPAGWQLPPRQLHDYQLQYCKAGTVEYVIEGEVIAMTPGTLLLIRPYERHEIRSAPDVSHICYSFVFHFGEASDAFDNWFGAAHHWGDWRNHPVEHKLSQLATLYQQPGREHRLRCQSLLLDILAEMLHRKQAESADGASRINDLARGRMNLVRTHILHHYSEDIRHERLEKVAGIGRNHIIRQFRRIYGVTPMHYLTLVRIEQAKSLALQTNLSVGEIASRVGYADVHTFGRAFKRITGASLSQYCAGMVIM